MSSKAAAIALAVAFATALCVCLLTLAVVGALFLGLASRVTSPLSPNAPPILPPPFIPTPTLSATQTAQEIESAMDEIEQQVMTLRGLSAPGPVDRQLMTPDELKAYNIKSFEEDYSRDEARDDTLSLAAFGLLEPSFELYDFYIDLYSEDILGMYDDEARQLFVITDRGTLGAVERVTFAHEFQHVLQDQNYGLAALGLSDEGWEEDSERSAGAQALIEGEATLLEQIWQDKYFTEADWDDYYANAYADPDSAYFRAPAYLQKDFYFPYDQGYQFVKRLYDRGGWAEVDAAYKNQPVSTEMILHPEKYDADETPQIVAATVLTDTLGAGWRQVDSGVMGEWYTSLVLEQHLAENTAATAAAGWGGDHYTVSHDEAANQTAAVWHMVWDTTSDAEEFVDAFKEYGDARFGGTAEIGDGSLCWKNTSAATCLYFSPQAALWIYAPDEATLEKLKGSVDF
ncbi:MAG: hypothetical protein AAB427_06695 [Chloroflexota bacterium]